MNNKFNTVAFSAAHISEAAEIERLCFSEPWSEEALGYMYSSPHAYAVACVDSESGRVAAYGGLEYVLDEAELTNIATHPDFRRQGCANAVTDALERFVKLHGVKRIWLDVRVSNEPAIALYRKLGFEDAGVRRHFYRFPTEDALLMVKELK
jgi:ribosomal-protein-alanine N-acetyltransferase